MKKRLLMLLCICGIVSSLFACGDDEEDVAVETTGVTLQIADNEETTTQDNGIQEETTTVVKDDTEKLEEKYEVSNNGGTVIKYGEGYIYWKYNSGSYKTQAPLAEYSFISTNNNELIYEKADGTKECILTTTGAGEIYITENHIYFEKYVSDYETEICSVGKNNGKWDGTSLQIVCKGDIHAIDTDKDVMIVSRENNNKTVLSVMDTDTGSFTDTNKNGTFIMYDAGKIYYQGPVEDYANAVLGELTIYVADLKGESSLLIKTTPDMYDFADGGEVAIQCMQIYDGYVYYSYGNYAGTGNYYQGGNICRITLDGKNNEVFATYAAQDFYVYDENGKAKLIYADAYDSVEEISVKQIDVETKEIVDSTMPLGALKKPYYSSADNYTYYDGTAGEHLTILTVADYTVNTGEKISRVDVENIEVIDNTVFYTIVQSEYNPAVSVGWRDGYNMVKTEVYCKNLDDGKIRLVYGYPENVSDNKEEETTSAVVVEKETTTKKESTTTKETTTKKEVVTKEEATTKQQVTTEKETTTQKATTEQTTTKVVEEETTTAKKEEITEKIPIQPFAHITFDGDVDEGYKAVKQSGDASDNIGDGADYAIVDAPNAKLTYEEGPVGKCLFVDGTFGLDLGLKPTNTDTYTISFWVNATRLATFGPTLQLGYNMDKMSDVGNNVTWLNITQSEWGDNYERIFPVIWSRSETADATDGTDCWPWLATFDNTVRGRREWIMITIVCNDDLYVSGLTGATYAYAELYINGEKCFDTHWDTWTKDPALAPNIMKPTEGAEFEAFFGINYWDTIFKGYVDDLYIYDTVLTSGQIATLYKLGNADCQTGVE